ncbi:hypothetical protein D187_005439 [Cystobacter fuscus DSM 2262]|uniref:Uncharacterized protein n=1 Tax=Cystobacter fuscus (strain ATCC 25194 / DSM 2262 / NBRC 100088 / M29) TaxID=1242864 RepID=S9PJ24_CYSF2|nr:hypothetical protein D187_005439 [Cystobacter fuscus DSM 2262]
MTSAPTLNDAIASAFEELNGRGIVAMDTRCPRAGSRWMTQPSAWTVRG